MTTNESNSGSSSAELSNGAVETDGPNFDRTTLQVGRAMAGSRESIEWVIQRFGPSLTEQARYRMPRLLSGLYGIEDVVQDVWIAVLPRLGTLESRGKGMTSVLLRYFSTALVNRINELARRHARGERLERSQGSGTHLSRMIAETTGVRSRASREEAAEILHSTLSAMDPLDREVLILRGIEQHSNNEAAELVGSSVDTVSHRYSRALDKLRQKLPNSLFDDIAP